MTVEFLPEKELSFNESDDSQKIRHYRRNLKSFQYDENTAPGMGNWVAAAKGSGTGKAPQKSGLCGCGLHSHKSCSGALATGVGSGGIENSQNRSGAKKEGRSEYDYSQDHTA